MKQLIAAILFLLSTVSFAGSLSFKSDSTNYLIGEQAVFTLKYSGDENPTWHNFNDTLTNELEIISLSAIDTLTKGQYKQTFLITSWDSGYFVVPPIKIGKHQSEPSLLRFNTVKIDPQADFKPIKDQMDTPFIFDEIKALLLWSLLIIALMITGIIFAKHYLKKSKANQPEPTIPERPVMEVLLERYELLASSKVWERGQEKEFHVELSLILRKYLEFKYRIKALEETTGNITIQLKSLGIDKVFLDEVSHILNFSDMVKFAKQKGVYTQHENALNVLENILKTHEQSTIE